MMWTASMGWGMWLFMGLVTLAFWTLVALALKDLVWPGPRRDRFSRSGDALRLLDERLARGEIDAAQYVEAKRLLTRPTLP